MVARLRARERGEFLAHDSFLPDEKEGVRSYNKRLMAVRSTPLSDRIDKLYNQMTETVNMLRFAMDSGQTRAVCSAIKVVMERILRSNSDPQDIFVVTPEKKAEREVFVSLGGVRQLMRYFSPPFGENLRGYDGTLDQHVHTNADLWNDMLVILREVTFSIPNSAELVVSDEHVCFLFRLLECNSVFEHAINLLEEVLAVKSELFSLEKVPNFFRLTKSLTLRQLSHFCKILGLLLFEPEEKAIADGSLVMRGVDLVTLRHERLLRPNSVLEKNQTLIAEVPGLLEKFILVLKVLNYGPDIGEIIKLDAIAQGRSPLPEDILEFNTKTAEGFRKLISLARLEEGRGILSDDESSDSDDDPPVVIEDDIMTQLLESFTVNNGEDEQMTNVSAISCIIGLATKLNIGRPTTRGKQLLMWAASTDQDPAAMETLSRLMSQRVEQEGNNGTSTSAKNELRFHAMVLAPYQVEICLVLCTMLSGRSKIKLQKKLAKLDIAPVLLAMQRRMSWEAGSGPSLEHVHGPGCECNFGSPLRVQFLRLIHSFFDGDFQNNPTKELVLSKPELKLVRQLSWPEALDRAYTEGKHKGLIASLVEVHQNEKVERPFKFWVALCIEAYLRGSRGQEQMFMARCGILDGVLKVMTVDPNSGPSAINLLQTAYDMLGELIRNNPHGIALLNSALDDKQFSKFMDMALANLVESNVFLKCCYLTLEAAHIHKVDKEQRQRQGVRPRRPLQPGYLTTSWLQFAPKPLSKRAIRSTLALQEKNHIRSTQSYASGADKVDADKERAVAQQTLFFPDSSDEEEKFFTPPESPKDISGSTLVTSEAEVEALVDAMAESTLSDAGAGSGPSPSPLDLDLGTGWSLEDDTFRLGMFLFNERDQILLRCMDAVTFHTVNHENICVINTILTLLMVAHRRGHLASSLCNIRRLADSRVPTSQRSQYIHSKDATQDDVMSGGDRIMLNFRELLWFWREFYLRRGRDRISVEYGTQVPFHYFSDIVRLLCADDGSPYSLLKSPPRMMKSPYQNLRERAYVV